MSANRSSDKRPAETRIARKPAKAQAEPAAAQSERSAGLSQSVA